MTRKLGVAVVLVGLGVTSLAGAQESALAGAKDATKSAPTNAEAAIVYGRALRKAGRDAESLTELRRAVSFAMGSSAVMVNWEIARTHIANDQAWHERNNLDANYKVRHDNRHGDPNQAHQSAFSRSGPTCFGPMI